MLGQEIISKNFWFLFGSFKNCFYFCIRFPKGIVKQLQRQHLFIVKIKVIIKTELVLLNHLLRNIFQRIFGFNFAVSKIVFTFASAFRNTGLSDTT